jgi:hypothetical protein
MHMSVPCKPCVWDYCTKPPIMQPSYTVLVNMSHIRFLANLVMLQSIIRHKWLRGQPAYDPLNNMWPAVNNLTSKFQGVYTPEEAVTHKNAVCACWGYIIIWVNTQEKLHKYRIKLCQLCVHHGDICWHTPYWQRTQQCIQHCWQTVSAYKKKAILSTWIGSFPAQNSACGKFFSAFLIWVR